MKFCKYPFLILFLTVFFNSTTVPAQQKLTYEGIRYELHHLPYQEKDTIEYLTNIDKFDKEKPTVVYLQGSLPYPLVLTYKDSLGKIVDAFFNISNFNSHKLVDNFNLILIARPYTPAIASLNMLAENYTYVPDRYKPNCVDSNFSKTDNLYYTSKRISFLINALYDQNVINHSKRLLLIGHSQGSDEAIRVAKLNSKVTDVAMLSSSPIGRIQYLALWYHMAYYKGEISFKEYEQKRDEMLATFKKDCADTTIVNPCGGDSPLNVYSYSEPPIDDIVATNANIFCGFGTKDMTSLYTELISIACIKAKKENLTIKLYEGREHNFFKVKDDGTIDHNDGYWDVVIDDILKWYKNN